MSAVNLYEVETRLLRDGLSSDEALKLLAPFKLTLAAFAESDAQGASALYPETKALGLSLGDRACLALASRLRLTVWTADKVWKKLKVDIEIELIRV